MLNISDFSPHTLASSVVSRSTSPPASVAIHLTPGLPTSRDRLSPALPLVAGEGSFLRALFPDSPHPRGGCGCLCECECDSPHPRPLSRAPVGRGRGEFSPGQVPYCVGKCIYISKKYRMTYIRYEGPRRIIKARALRRSETLAEKTLWERVRNRQLGGYKIRRQQILDEIIVDFYCCARRLCIEIDGPYHKDPSMKIRDQQRDSQLLDQGYTVLRFTNDQILFHLESVLQAILDTLNSLPATGHNPLRHDPWFFYG